MVASLCKVTNVTGMTLSERVDIMTLRPFYLTVTLMNSISNKQGGI